MNICASELAKVHRSLANMLCSNTYKQSVTCLVNTIPLQLRLLLMLYASYRFRSDCVCCLRVYSHYYFSIFNSHRPMSAMQISLFILPPEFCCCVVVIFFAFLQYNQVDDEISHVKYAHISHSAGSKITSDPCRSIHNVIERETQPNKCAKKT